MIVAMFRHQNALSQALDALREAGVGPLETYTPAPLDGAGAGSPIPAAILCAGLLGGAASFALQAWSSISAYPFDVGGRPLFAWASFVPTVFENGVLAAVVAGFAAFMAVNRLPRLHDPVDEADAMRQASGDGWVVAVRTEDQAVLSRARALLGRLHATTVEEVAP